MLKLFALKEVYAKDDGGATAIEYSLIAAGIALAIAAVVFTFGQDLVAMFDNMGTALEG